MYTWPFLSTAAARRPSPLKATSPEEGLISAAMRSAIRVERRLPSAKMKNNLNCVGHAHASRRGCVYEYE